MTAATRYHQVQVETIGDCYTIVSGLPHETKRHAAEMAEIAVGIQKVVQNTEVAHMPAGYVLANRIGINSGPVATGVIGLHAPRYCLFGDTVRAAVVAHNVSIQVSPTASRVESIRRGLFAQLSTKS